jgi:SAM-dependent methyltransferase
MSMQVAERQRTATTDLGLEQTSCDLCGAADHAVLFAGGDRRHDLPGVFTIVQCRWCDHVYLNPRPDDRTRPLYYPEDYSPYSGGGGLTARLTPILRRREAARMRRWVPPGGRILEIGCATGDLLVPLRDEGYDVTGVEMSPYASAVARDRHGLNVHTGTLADAPFAERSYDAVVMRSVIEHLPSPTTDLRRTARLLEDRGHLFITTDNVASLDRRAFGEYWYGFDVPRHLNLFSPETLSRVLAGAGFVVRLVRYSLVPNHWIVSARYLAQERAGRHPVLRSIVSLLSLQNPLLLGALLPVTLLQRLRRCGGRMSVVATKSDTVG